MDLDAMDARAAAVKRGPWPLEKVGDFHEPGWMIPNVIRDPRGDNALDFGTDRALGEFVKHAREDVPDLVARVRELENAAPSEEGTRADILRWAAHQLHQTPVQCTALTGPVWYGQGWKDAKRHLEDLADGEAHAPGDYDERSPLYERIAAAALTVPIRLGPATIRNAQAGQTVTRLSGAEADHVAQVVMDALANRIDVPRDQTDPRTEVEAHTGDTEQIIAVWETDQAQWRARVEDLERENARLQQQSDQRWVGWRSACARAVNARENEKTERFFAHAAEEELVKLRRAHKSLQIAATRYRTDRDDAWHTLENQEDEDVIREEGRREGIAELVAHLGDVAAEARTGRDAGYPEESEGLGPTRWCLLTDRAHRLARKYADGQGAPVPDATARAKALEKELEREQGRHAREVFDLKRQMAGQLLGWQEEHTALEKLHEARGVELAALKTSSRRRELVLVDRLRRRGERLRRAETWYALSELGANRVNELLDLATRFRVGPVTVFPHGEGWRCSWPDPTWPGAPGQGPTLTEDHVDRFDALVRASQISAQALADATPR